VFVSGCGGSPGFTGLVAAEVEFVAPPALVGVGDKVKVADMVLVYPWASKINLVGMRQVRTLR
jgi:hypothetical protein